MKKNAIYCLLLLTACSQSPEAVSEDNSGVAGAATASNDPVAECAKRGVAYFKEIGSFPTLSSAPNAGRDAAEVALERCRRTTTAF
jgi:hypothetical protein